MVRGVIKIFRNILSMSKILLLLLFAIFLPRIFMSHINTKLYNNMYGKKKHFKLGLENITDTKIQKLKQCNIALITNQTGKDQLGRRNIDMLLNTGIKIKKIFCPEHGLDGKTAAGKKVKNSVDIKTKIPVISLYPGNKTKALSNNNLKDIDTIIFDMQGAGMRHYTYVTTLFQSIDAAISCDKKIIVLDRPNLLGPIIEGPLVEKNYKSGISFAPIPLRYGMTMGELASYYNKYISKTQANLTIVPMKHYKRDSIVANKLLSHLSPNIKNIFSCHGYSFLGLLGEIKPFNTGVGTDEAFQLILIPETIQFSKKKWQELHKILHTHGVQSHFYRQFNKQKNCYYCGLKLRIKNISYTRSFKMLMQILQFFKKAGITMEFSKYFDKAIGTNKVRSFLEDHYNWKKLVKAINRKLFIFYNKAAHCFLYKPYPRVEYL